MAKAKKDLTGAAAASANVFDMIAQGGAQKEKETPKKPKDPDAQRIYDAQEAQATRGVKGAKMPRLNLAITPSNHDYVRIMAAIKGETMTNYINEIITREREENSETYKEAKRLIDKSR